MYDCGNQSESYDSQKENIDNNRNLEGSSTVELLRENNVAENKKDSTDSAIVNYQDQNKDGNIAFLLI